MRGLLIVAGTVLLLTGCQDKAPAPAKADTSGKIMKIAVSAKGEIQADGKPVSLENLSDQLAALRGVGGAVWYHRENPDQDPHPNAEKVIDLIIANGLPVRLSTKPDFSDSVGGDEDESRLNDL